MEREEVSRMPILPDDLVEKILGMVPFPNIFKARALSKLWLARLSPVSSQDDDQVTSSLAISFQRRMDEYWTAKWIFCPVLLHKEDLVVHNPRSHKWEKMPLLSFLPENYIKSKFRLLAGALLIIVTGTDQCELLVANLLTRTSRLLPHFPRVLESCYCFQITPVIHEETYTVIALYRSKFGLSFALIYDSKVNAWRRKQVEVPEGFTSHSAGVYLNGVVYWLVGPKEDSRGLLLFKVVEETLLFLEMPSTSASSILKVCAGSLLMACFSPHEGRPPLTVKAVDIESRNWLEVTRGPPKAPCGCRLITFVHDVIDLDSLFVLIEKCFHENNDRIVLVYSVHHDRLISFGRLKLAEEDSLARAFLSLFQPGLNPFMRP